MAGKGKKITRRNFVKNAAALGRMGVTASRLAKVGGWIYTAAELAVVLYLADEIESRVNAWLDMNAARDALGDAGRHLVRIRDHLRRGARIGRVGDDVELALEPITVAPQRLPQLRVHLVPGLDGDPAHERRLTTILESRKFAQHVGEDRLGEVHAVVAPPQGWQERPPNGGEDVAAVAAVKPLSSLGIALLGSPNQGTKGPCLAVVFDRAWRFGQVGCSSAAWWALRRLEKM